MIPVPGKSLCYAHIDLGANTNECLNHKVSFATREELGEHMDKMKRRWLWRHHPFRMLADWWVHRFVDGLGR